MNITNIDPKRNYWLVRTQGGTLYDEFLKEKIISIGWDQITTLDGHESNVIQFIREQYPEERQLNYAYKQMNKFIYDIQIGDVVLIPSPNSQYITFGIVESDLTILSSNNITEGIQNKRKSVNWIKTEARRNLDPNLFWLFTSHHIISNANDYAQYIDKTLNSFFIKGNNGHFLIHVKKKENIDALEMFSITKNMLDVIKYVNYLYDTNYQLNELKQKSNIQSPGVIEFIGSGDLILKMGTVVQLLATGNFISKIRQKTKNEEHIQSASDFENAYLEGLSNLKAELPKEISEDK